MCCCGCQGCFVLTENITFSCFFHSSLPRSAVTVNCAVCVFPQIIKKKSWLTVFVSEHKVIIVGLDNAGKTTILYQFLMNEVVHTSPTIGSNVEEIVVKNTHFLMWDIGGQESLRSSWNTYYSNTEFIILVVDSTDRERLAISKEELYRMLAHEDLRKAAVLIFANKQDMKDCMSAAEISKYLTLSSIKDHPWHIQSCCALTGEGLCQGLEWMTSRAGLR
uniref:ADP ribosylation factor like GTPase 5B n=1 Tax=Xiphophorus couchianus TaxID=32473 RepID=A0A3B5LVP7_9TELE